LGNIIPIVIFFLILGVVIFIHELGHFLMARRAGIFVIEFAMGMGPKLLTFRGKKKTSHPIEGQEDVTIYTLRALPIGGFCSVRGQDEDMTDDPEAMTNKTIWQRTLFMAGGSIFNFVMALVLFFVFVMLTGYVTPLVVAVPEGTPAHAGGMMPGDTVTHINGSRVRLWENFRFVLDNSGGRPVDIRVDRNGVAIDLVVMPVLVDDSFRVGAYMARRAGILTQVEEGVEVPRAGVVGSFTTAVDMIGFHIRAPFRMIARMVTQEPVADGMDIMGPIGIGGIVVSVYQDASERGFVATMMPMLLLLALINVALGVMNLLPIPALDGARLLFLFLEGIRGKPISREREGMVHLVGMAVLIVLGIFIAYRDIVNLRSNNADDESRAAIVQPYYTSDESGNNS